MMKQTFGCWSASLFEYGDLPYGLSIRIVSGVAGRLTVVSQMK